MLALESLEGCHRRLMSETSTGALQDFRPITKAAREVDALVIADAVTSLGAVPVSVDEMGIDIAYSCSQKGIGAPPGLSPVTFSPRAMEVVRERKTPCASYMPALCISANDTSVPALPASICSIWSSEPIKAFLPVASTKSQAASTLGPMEPLGNACCASMCGVPAKVVDRAEEAARQWEHTSRLRESLEKAKGAAYVPLGMLSDVSWMMKENGGLGGRELELLRRAIATL